ncbi:tumor rejection antigen P815A-like, partial [Phodopus roborovskii]|uniref:tumor rejection antigen P815A-like n=1 Tax=Phodopus roborovskii TaxID=109678 RepID=UPI0021E4C67E
MAYINYEDWAVGDLCSKSGSDGDLDLREEFLIVALFSLEWLVFVGILGVLTFQIILQTIWESEEEEQEVADIASVLLKPPPLNEEQQNEYAKDDGFEFDFSEDFFEDLDLKEYLNEEESKEEDDDDSGNSSVCSTVGRFLCDEVKYKLSYYFHHLGILKSQSLVTNEPTAYECETSDESFEGIADEEKWGEDESGNLEGESYEDAEFAEWYFPEEC